MSTCPDCGREKSVSAGDMLRGCCPKWYAIMDKEAIMDCEKYSRPSFILMNSEIEGVDTQLVRPVFEYLPEKLNPKGRRLQILIRMHGSRPDKPHDNWYVIQIISQSHRGVNLAPKGRCIHGIGGESWLFQAKNKVPVMFHSSTKSEAATPRIWTATDGTVHFNTWNAMGRLDNIPIIIDKREYEAVREAVLAYNEKFSNPDPEEVTQI